MKEIKEQLKNKSYVINPIVLKNICNLEIDIKEFLLLLYFMNEKNELDLDDIKEKIGLIDNDILNVFNSLINKKMIEIVMKKDNKNIKEEISLDLFFDKLLLNNVAEEEKESDIYTMFEKEFGRTLSPIEYETISNWLYNNIDEETIVKALKEAVLNGVTSLRYIDKILSEWTKEDAKKDYVELFDYDWLGDSKND